jgi:hypothetical protein
MHQIEEPQTFNSSIVSPEYTSMLIRATFTFLPGVTSALS